MTSAASVFIRPVAPQDAEALLALAGLLNTMNLPQDAAAIAALIAESQESFARLATGPAAHRGGWPQGTYTLVAVQGERLVGTASLFSHHGTPASPHYYFEVREETRHSVQLNLTRTVHLLRLRRDVQPWTELGGLVVHPQARGQGVGKLLVAARLLLVAMHPDAFCRRLIAELMPPRRGDGSSAFWDAIGAPLTGLDLPRADHLCRQGKEFIEALFPKSDLILELLPLEAQAVTAQVGPATLPVRKLLERAGFRYLESIDPFDGGPHYGAALEEVLPLRQSRCLVCLDLPLSEAGVPLLLGHPQSHCFLVAPAQICGHGLRLAPATSEQLGLRPGDPVWTLPLDW
ncbi:MAG: arginine N-succinyltransferase [Candidatus Tectimicrobiota bacterium]|nr:MAG: arginine N-succinyltransferase [Candidatus Tectomicrobia bacterium]